jgi:hypothetical protein
LKQLNPLPLDPPLSPEGVVIVHDDPAILPESLLVRHINPDHHVVPDENTKGLRISSGAFAATTGDPDHGMSIDIGQLLTERGLPDRHMVPQHMGAVSVGVGDLRAIGLKIGSDPIPTNEFHGQAWGVKTTTRKAVQKLVKGWIVPLPGVALR